MSENRNVITREDDHFRYGHREALVDGVWVQVSRSDFVMLRQKPWFIGSPLDRMARVNVVDVPMERAIEFEQLVDADPYAGYHYLAIAAEDGQGAEALKWIMGALAAELNARKLTFAAIGSLMTARMLSRFVTAMADGRIDRTFSKAIFAEMVGRAMTDEAFADLLADSRFKAVDSSALEAIVDAVIAANPDQYAKAIENPKLGQWFVGQVMKASGGKARPDMVKEILARKIAQ